MTPTRFSRLIGIAPSASLRSKSRGGELDDRRLVRIRPQPLDRVVDEQEAVVERGEVRPQAAQQRRERDGRAERREEAVADVAGDDELRADRQEAREVANPARRRVHAPSCSLRRALRSGARRRGAGRSSSRTRGTLRRIDHLHRHLAGVEPARDVEREPARGERLQQRAETRRTSDPRPARRAAFARPSPRRRVARTTLKFTVRSAAIDAQAHEIVVPARRGGN